MPTLVWTDKELVEDLRRAAYDRTNDRPDNSHYNPKKAKLFFAAAKRIEECSKGGK